MNKSDAIRHALRAGKFVKHDVLRDRVERKLEQVIGRQVLYTQLAVMATKGEIEIDGRGDARSYRLVR